jgi:hypothetical protein
MSEPIFHMKLLSHYQLVTKPGTYYVSVAYTMSDSNLYFKDEHPRYIVPLRALTGEGLQQLIIALQDAANGVVPFSEIRHLFLTGALWYNEGNDFEEKDLPIGGEKVLANFEYVDRDGEKKLLCTKIELLPREELDYVDINQYDQFRLTIQNLITKSIT